jgi:hypothetical protein
VLIAKWFGAERYGGTPGLLAKIGLYGVLVGTPVVTVSTFLEASPLAATSGELTILGSIPMLASVFVMCAVAAEEAKRLRVKGPLGIVRESLTFGLLFLPYWINIVVMLPSVYIDSHYTRFAAQDYGVYYLNAFTTGHEHALVTLTAILLFMLVALMFGVKGKTGALAGLTLVAGYIVSTTANTYYMFNLLPNGSEYVPYIGDGIALMVIGVLVGLVGMTISIARRFLRPQPPSLGNGLRSASSTEGSGA